MENSKVPIRVTALETINNKIESCKVSWLVGCRCRSTETMAMNASMVEFLICLKKDIGLITESRYITDIADFSVWRKENAALILYNMDF